MHRCLTSIKAQLSSTREGFLHYTFSLYGTYVFFSFSFFLISLAPHRYRSRHRPSHRFYYFHLLPPALSSVSKDTLRQNDISSAVRKSKVCISNHSPSFFNLSLSLSLPPFPPLSFSFYPSLGTSGIRECPFY